MDERFYVAAGSAGETRWVPFLDQDPNVRLRVGDTVHELRAVRVEDDFELRAVRKRYMAKYDLEEGDAMAAEAWIYRLDSRPAEW